MSNTNYRYDLAFMDCPGITSEMMERAQNAIEAWCEDNQTCAFDIYEKYWQCAMTREFVEGYWQQIEHLAFKAAYGEINAEPENAYLKILGPVEGRTVYVKGAIH